MLQNRNKTEALLIAQIDLTGSDKAIGANTSLAVSQWKEVEVMEHNVQADHVHMEYSIPPKISVSEFMGILKGKLAIRIFQSYPDLKLKPYWSNHFWAKGYFIITIGLDEELIRYQESKERKRERR
ncbi:MAG: IS200/IS605 family transposase [Flavobacteriaceae bacterium]